MLKFISGDLSKLDTGCLVIPVCKDKEICYHPLIIRLVEKALKIDEFKGKSGEELFLYDVNEVQSKRVLFIGLGNVDKLNLEA